MFFYSVRNLLLPVILFVDLVTSTYFWMVVQSARRQWAEERHGCADVDLREVASATQSNNGNGPKSPSFLSQNFAMFESPRPHTILPK